MPPFTVLHVCVGNICRSPMAERLLLAALRRRAGDEVTSLYFSHGAGTGSWHVGEPMNAPAARQLELRGGDSHGFRARKISGSMIDSSDLVLCATAEQLHSVLDLRRDAEGRTFVLGEFGRLLRTVDLRILPPAPPMSLEGRYGRRAAQAAYDRAVALVIAVDAARGGGAVWGLDGDARLPARRGDDLADPWGMADSEFARVADEIERTIGPLAAALTG